MIDEYEDFVGCKNVLLLLSDMNFAEIGFSAKNELEDIWYSDETMRQDIERVFGQSKVGDNI